VSGLEKETQYVLSAFSRKLQLLFPFSFSSPFKKLDVRIHLDEGQGILWQVSAAENICI